MKKRKTSIFTVIGLLLIAAALLLTVYNIYADKRAGITAENALEQLKYEIDNSDEEYLIQDGETEVPVYEVYEDVDMPQIKIDGVYYIGILSIPSIGIELPIKGEFSYPALTGAPCRYSGSVYKNDIIIAGHNYPSHFRGLKNMSIGDSVTFTDADGHVFTYTVAEITQLSGTDVETMESGEWDMTLFTCTLSGKQRVTVRLNKVGP